MNEQLLAQMMGFGVNPDPFSANYLESLALSPLAPAGMMQPQGATPQAQRMPASQAQSKSVSMSQGSSSPVMSQDTFELLKQRELEAMEAQRAGIADFEQQAAKLQGQKPDNVLLALMGLSDVLSGSGNIAQTVQAERQKQLQDLGLKAQVQGMKKDLGKQEIDLLKAQFNKEQEDKRLASYERIAYAKAGDKPSEFFKKYSGKLGTEMAEFVANDRPTMLNNIGKIDSALAKMQSGDVVTGTWAKTLAPDTSLTFDKAARDVKADMDSAIMDTLRPTLGAQFTAVEGQQVKELTFDPKQPIEVNMQRAQRLRDFIAKKTAFTDALKEYLIQNNGSDLGFPYEQYGMEPIGQVGTTPAKTAPPIGTVKGKFKFKGGDPADKNSWEPI